jgi:FkbH-like protein
MKDVSVRVVSDVVCNNIFRNSAIAVDKELKFKFSPVDQFVQEIVSSKGDDFMLLYISQYAFNSYEISSDFAGEIRNLLGHLSKLVSTSTTKVILNTIHFDSPSFAQEEFLRKENLSAEVNSLIREFAFAHPDACLVVDVAKIIVREGSLRNVSFRNYSVMRSPYSTALTKAIRSEYSFHISSYFGVRKKVIFVDADNTLWGGVVGEDGPDGVKVDHEYPGSHYFNFQEMLFRLKRVGLLLCLVTKNNVADIEEIFRVRKMPLGLEDFVLIQANWERKSKNIAYLLENLNVGSSSAIFIDDNPFEIEEVSRVFPDMLCMQFDLNTFNVISGALTKLPQLYSHNLTAEDVMKTESYAQEARRNEGLNASGSLEEYLRDLSIRVHFRVNDLDSAVRVSQLTQKTNQFNLTTKRYSVAEIETLMASQKVYSFSVEDKFGEMGVVGVAILCGSEIDTFLLSCRAFGREIEKAMLSVLIDNVDSYPLTARYEATPKNVMTKDFYSDNGFEIVRLDDCSSSFALSAKLTPYAGCIQEIVWN